MRFVPGLSAEEAAELRRLYKEGSTHRLRQRAQAILLSARGWRVDALAEVFESDRDTVSRWLDHWEGRVPGAPLEAALADAPKSGRPAKLSAADEEEPLAHAATGRPNLKAEALAACKKRARSLLGYPQGCVAKGAWELSAGAARAGEKARPRPPRAGGARFGQAAPPASTGPC